MSDYSVTVPAGWIEQPPSTFEAQLEQIREVSGTRRIDMSVYLAPDHTAQLTVVRQMLMLDDVSRDTLERFDRGIVSGSANKATKHVSDERHFEGDRLLATTVDAQGELLVKQSRIIVADRDDVVHALSVICAGRPEDLGACEQAQATMQLTVANTVTPRSESEDSAYKLGYTLGSVAVLAVAAWGLFRIFKRHG